MAWVTPTNVATGDVLTASRYNQDVIENGRFGQPTFTTEAARDAAISSPSEGMVAYLTAPTVPAASGGVTAVPTGVTTIYNGSVWVCTTSVSARTADNGTTTSSSYGTLTGGGTNPSVTLVTGTTALVFISGWIANSNTATGNRIGVAVSGATTLAASDDFCVYQDVATANYNLSNGYHYVITGLTAGTNTFTLNYKTTSGTSSVSRRSLTVRGVA
jgi:hypothetical protein